MKAKTNLELFNNEMIYNLEHVRCKSLYDAMVAIYVRESPSKVINYENMLNWFLDAPRETLELDAYSYHLINEYYSVLLEEAMVDVNSKAIDWFTMFKTLIRMDIIPSSYSQLSLAKFMKIIRLKKENNK